jgi:hypothetical protein
MGQAPLSVSERILELQHGRKIRSSAWVMLSPLAYFVGDKHRVLDDKGNECVLNLFSSLFDPSTIWLKFVEPEKPSIEELGYEDLLESYELINDWGV